MLHLAVHKFCAKQKGARPCRRPVRQLHGRTPLSGGARPWAPSMSIRHLSGGAGVVTRCRPSSYKLRAKSGRLADIAVSACFRANNDTDGLIEVVAGLVRNA
ncbi:hypothetical protein C882_0736 [Caenispirillum salinarum AK4]|uniref:Uncharacterized protein n=1 Tax=Caenispirillum salinarum AK4 TaxID=1238182 RepID=K9GUS3_9PROT|nr:hypothetical protein C882_0736 [Caenispirillum salinarum AK4]